MKILNLLSSTSLTLRSQIFTTKREHYGFNDNNNSLADFLTVCKHLTHLFNCYWRILIEEDNAFLCFGSTAEMHSLDTLRVMKSSNSEVCRNQSKCEWCV